MKVWQWLIGAPFVSWPKQIEVLQTATPLALPAIKPLKAVKAKRKKKAATVTEFRRNV